MFPSRVRGLVLGAAAADLRYHALAGGRVLPGAGVPGDDDPWVPSATRLLWAALESQPEWDGFDGPDQARRFTAAVASLPTGGFTTLERLAAAMLHDGADWTEPSQLLARTADAQTHDATVRALVAAIVAVDNEPYRSWLAEKLAGLTHGSPTAAAAAVVVTDAAAALLRGDDGQLRAGYEPLRAGSVAGAVASSSACALDVARSVLGVVGSTSGIVEALEAVRYRWWADARVAVLTGALAGARHGESTIPRAWLHAVVDGDRLAKLGTALAERAESFPSRARSTG